MKEDYKIEISVKNQRIYDAMAAKGFTNYKDLGTKAHVCHQTVRELINFNLSPKKRVRGEFVWRKPALRLAKALDKTPEELFVSPVRGREIQGELEEYLRIL